MIMLLDDAVLVLDDETRLDQYQVILDTLSSSPTSDRIVDLATYEPALSRSNRVLVQRRPMR